MRQSSFLLGIASVQVSEAHDAYADGIEGGRGQYLTRAIVSLAWLVFDG